MSVVTNVVLTFASSEKRSHVLNALKEFKYNGSDSFNATSIEDEALPRKWYGGSKMMECNVCVGAFNNLDVDGLVSFLRSMSWDDPDAVQLMIQGHLDHRFRLINVFS